MQIKGPCLFLQHFSFTEQFSSRPKIEVVVFMLLAFLANAQPRIAAKRRFKR